MAQPLVTIAFVPREVFSTTRRSLESLFEGTHEAFEMVCLDGGSPPEVGSYLERSAREREFTLIRTNRAITPNQARNLALSHVNTPFVAFVDNDVLVDDGWLEPLLECAEETGAWAVAPLYFEGRPPLHRIHMAGGTCHVSPTSDGSRAYQEIHRHAHELIADLAEPVERQETELLEFHTVLVSMAAFEALGPLDEGLLCHKEHADFSLLIREAGERIFLEPRSRITYAPPERILATDRDFFELRWCEVRCEASVNRFAQKWNLQPDDEGLRVGIQWLRRHRYHARPTVRFIARFLGYRIGAWVYSLVLGRLEILRNRRRFPAHLSGRPEPPEARTVVESSARIRSLA